MATIKASITRPMLASAVKDESKLQFPLIASPKIDGIRCLKVDGQILSRSFKPIPNKYIRFYLEKILPEGADGEITVGDNFQDCTSGIMSHEGEPDFKYWMFDLIHKGFTTEPYEDRINRMMDWGQSHPNTRVHVVDTAVVTNLKELAIIEKMWLKAGHEGVMLRTPDSPYKCGRSTVKQGWLLKLKRFVDSEAEILQFEEQQENTNAKETNELGLSKRSTAKAGKVGKGTLGKFVVRDINGNFNVDFRIGTGEGLTDELRQEIWDNKEQYRGRICKYKYQDIGTKDAPRLPIFLGFRDFKDL